MRVGRRAMRRPAGGADEAPMESVEEKWARGAVVKVGDVPPILFSEGTPVVLPNAHYYLRSCAVAGRLTGLEVKDGAMYALARLTGTTGEALLKYHTANPDAVFRVHLCREDCNQQEVSDLLPAHQTDPTDCGHGPGGRMGVEPGEGPSHGRRRRAGGSSCSAEGAGRRAKSRGRGPWRRTRKEQEGQERRQEEEEGKNNEQ